ncbi:MAG: alpha/beta hydrolase [Actinomycetota bacterium]
MTTYEFGDNTVEGASGGRDLGSDGPLVILVHGAAMNRSVWSLQTRWLAHHDLPSLAIDLPGHGNSPEDRRESVEDYADWLAGVVNAIDRPVHLVGHSMGSFVALETPSRADVASITLVGTASAMPVHPALLEAAEANDPLAAALMSGWAFAPGSRTGAHPSPGSSMVGGTQALIGQAAPGVLHSDLSLCAAYQGATDTAASVEVPTTLLLGQVDRMTPVPAAKPIIEAIGHARTEIVPGSGHMIQIEAPAVTRTVIAETVAAA